MNIRFLLFAFCPLFFLLTIVFDMISIHRVLGARRFLPKSPILRQTGMVLLAIVSGGGCFFFSPFFLMKSTVGLVLTVVIMAVLAVLPALPLFAAGILRQAIASSVVRWCVFWAFGTTFVSFIFP
jgi:hypothetical protein